VSLLHFYAVVSPAQWTRRVADELRLRLSAQIGVDVHLAAAGINVLVPVGSQKESDQALQLVHNTVSEVELDFAARSSQEGLAQLRITI
jgi:hypothetical protein